MDNRLVWQGYATHDLDEAASSFLIRTGALPEFFAVREDWPFTGSDENINKAVHTHLAPCYGIYIPKEITMLEFLAIESAWIERHSTAAAPYVPDETPSECYELTRYCNYCGRLFVTDENLKTVHCGLPECVERDNQYKDHVADVRSFEKHAQENAKPEPIVKADLTPDFELDDPKRTSVWGWIYFIMAENGLVKIGRSDNIVKRYGELRSMSPVKLELFHAVTTSNCINAEAWLHAQFAIRRDHGEWFNISAEDLEWAKTLSDYSLDRV